MARHPFDNLRVLDFSRVIAGPLISECLSQYGATVLRIESSASPDTLRLSAPYPNHELGLNRSGYFAAFNANKLSLSLNLKNPKAEQIILQLVKWADVIIENFSPGTMQRLHLDYSRLKQIKPEIIMLSSSNQGQSGPRSQMPGYGFTLCALSGLTALTGWPDRDACHPFGALTDFIAPLLATSALLAALEVRNRTAKGQLLDVSQYEASLTMMAPLLLEYLWEEKISQRMGNRSPHAAPHGAYPCLGSNCWCAISIDNDDEWKAFCEATGMTHLIESLDYRTIADRKQNERKLDEITANWCRQRKVEEVVHILQSAGVCAGKVNNVSDLFADIQLAHRNHFKTLEHPEIGKQSYEMFAFRLSNCPAILDRAAPLLGQNNEQICREILAMEDDQFVQMLIENVFD